MKPDQERVKNLLADTVTLLCKNGLTFQEELHVEGLIAITVDHSDVFVVHIDNKFPVHDETQVGVVPEATDVDPTDSHVCDSGAKDRNDFTKQKRTFDKDSPNTHRPHRTSPTRQHMQQSLGNVHRRRKVPEGQHRRSLSQVSSTDTAEHAPSPGLGDVKIKVEEEEVYIIEEGNSDDQQIKTETMSGQEDDTYAMQQSYTYDPGEPGSLNTVTSTDGSATKRRRRLRESTSLTDSYVGSGDTSCSGDGMNIVQNFDQEGSQGTSWMGASPADSGQLSHTLPGSSSWQLAPTGSPSTVQHPPDSDMVNVIVKPFIRSTYAKQEDDDKVRLSGDHIPVQLPPATEKRQRPTKRCRVCAKKKAPRRESRWICMQCPTHPGLCLRNCFELYHTKQQYWK